LNLHLLKCTQSHTIVDDRRKFESVYSNKVRAGKRRTYFFDVRQTRGEDYYLTITESTRRFNSDGYERHKIFLYKEDFNRFLTGMTDTINYVKNELMPDYDYDEYTRRHEEYEARRAAGEFDDPQPQKEFEPANDAPEPPQSVDALIDNIEPEPEIEIEDTGDAVDIDEEDMKW